MNKKIATTLALTLAAFASAKVGYHEYVFRSTAEDLVLRSHGKAARMACLMQSSQTRHKLAASDWSQSDDAELIIGDRNVDVAIWRINAPEWRARYRDPFIRIVAANRLTKIACNYDIRRRKARIAKL